MGGVAQSVPLTADLVARAVIAAAQVYGDSPERAFSAKRGLPRRCLAAAADGIMEATSCSVAAISRTLGIERTSIARGARKGGAGFRAASRAASYAGWRPEARETVVDTGGCAPPVIAGGAAADQVAAVEPAPAQPLVKAADIGNRFHPAPTSRPAKAVRPAPAQTAPPKGPAIVSDEDARHLGHIRAANGGRGFPAPVPGAPHG